MSIEVVVVRVCDRSAPPRSAVPLLLSQVAFFFFTTHFIKVHLRLLLSVLCPCFFFFFSSI